jgi:hypothetical protein
MVSARHIASGTLVERPWCDAYGTVWYTYGHDMDLDGDVDSTDVLVMACCGCSLSHSAMIAASKGKSVRCMVELKCPRAKQRPIGTYSTSA